MGGEAGKIPNALHMLFVAKSSYSNKLDNHNVNNDHGGNGPNLDLTCPREMFHQLDIMVGRGKNVIFKTMMQFCCQKTSNNILFKRGHP
jgi:hypothetical protein